MQGGRVAAGVPARRPKKPDRRIDVRNFLLDKSALLCHETRRLRDRYPTEASWPASSPLFSASETDSRSVRLPFAAKVLPIS
jgi:hypothetical protein